MVNMSVMSSSNSLPGSRNQGNTIPAVNASSQSKPFIADYKQTIPRFQGVSGVFPENNFSTTGNMNSLSGITVSSSLILKSFYLLLF